MIIAGIDEAGRGALIGPLVVAFFSIPKEKETALVKLCLKDSKQLSPKQRSYLYRRLKELGSFEVVKLQPTQIDMRNINKLELSVIEKLVEKHKPGRLFVDCFVKDCSSIHFPGVDVIAEYKADERYPIVSAASIIAKVVRDAEIRKLRERFGDFGSGYPSDEKTVSFVKEHLKELEAAHAIRTKWDTYKRLAHKPKQSSLTGLLEEQEQKEQHTKKQNEKNKKKN